MTRKPLAVVAVVGSRDYPDAEARVLDRLTLLKRDWPQVDWIVVSGGARGVDRAAATAARRLKMKLYEIPAEWDIYGKQAGVFRNTQIVLEVPVAKVGEPSRVIAFWDFTSRGTRHAIREAILNSRAVEIYDADYEPAGPEAAQEVFA